MPKPKGYKWKTEAKQYLAAIAGLQNREEIKDTWLKTNHPEIYLQQQEVVSRATDLSTVTEQQVR
jgi:hypothetical protein